MNVLINQRFLVSYRLLPVALIFPNGRVAKILIITLRLTVFSLILHAKMPAAGLLAFQSIQNQQLAELKKVGNPPRLFKRLVQLLIDSRNLDVGPEFFAQFRNFFKRVF